LSTLYIVATPIGNLNDISFRAVEILKSVDLIACEDTRHSQRLLKHFNIHTPLISYHEHNERESIDKLINVLKQKKSIALISDAGTPLISDPGYHLVKNALNENIKVVPIPGACAAIAALSVSGLASHNFIFEGFLPATVNSRRTSLEKLKSETRTLIFYEAPHRLQETLLDLSEVFEKEREATLCRELTKTFETIYKSSLSNLYNFVKNNPDQNKGECVIIISGSSIETLEHNAFSKALSLLKILLADLPLKKAVKITSELTSVSKNLLYDEALKLQKENP
jgi:16S rRNA (cytidine1402-2'-O)-methyltransferase